MINIIFLLGEAGVGKDSVAETFIEKGFTRVSFADALKKEFANKNEIDVSILHIQGKEKEKYRKKIIEFAEAARAIDPLIWLTKAFEPYINPTTHSFKDGLKLVITDFRRNAEVEWYLKVWEEKMKLYFERNAKFSQLDLKLIHVIRPGINDPDILTAHAIGMVYGIDLVHPGFIDAIINNDSTKEVLKEKVNNLLNSFNFDI